MKRIEGEVQPFDDTHHVENNEKGGEKGIEMNSSMQLLPSKIEFPDPCLESDQSHLIGLRKMRFVGLSSSRKQIMLVFPFL